jgi:hypothetical protein
MGKTINEQAALREGPRSFAVFLRDLSNGALDVKASEEWHNLAQAIEAEAMKRGKAKGTLTVKVLLTADDQGNADIKFAVDSKEPTVVHNGGPAWFTKGSNVALEPPGKEKRIRDVSTSTRIAERCKTPDSRQLTIDEAGPDGVAVSDVEDDEEETPTRDVRSL